jgi:hypothetical protein
MSTLSSGVPKGAMIAISDMLDNCAKIQPGQEVLLLAYIDGLYGGDNLVDQEAISLIQSAVQSRGANASILWVDEPSKAHAWRFPPIVKAALGGCDVLINNTFNLVPEEMVEYGRYLGEHKVRLVRNFVTTLPLLCTPWAQTPYELVCEIRYQASFPFKGGAHWQLSDDNGTHLEGIVVDPKDKPWGTKWAYSARRQERSYYMAFPEWVLPSVGLTKAIVSRMWWKKESACPTL